MIVSGAGMPVPRDGRHGWGWLGLAADAVLIAVPALIVNRLRLSPTQKAFAQRIDRLKPARDDNGK
ncbi:MAG: hypothetical protein WD069_21960 [Planctomycetales bacterium]